MTDTPTSPESILGKRKGKAGWFCGLSLALGVLAGLPYLLGISLFVFHIQQPLAMHIASYTLPAGFCSGILFGVPSIILAIFGWKRLERRRSFFWIPLLGILFSLVGFLGQLWFFGTCQFCQ